MPYLSTISTAELLMPSIENFGLSAMYILLFLESVSLSKILSQSAIFNFAFLILDMGISASADRILFASCALDSSSEINPMGCMLFCLIFFIMDNSRDVLPIAALEPTATNSPGSHPPVRLSRASKPVVKTYFLMCPWNAHPGHGLLYLPGDRGQIFSGILRCCRCLVQVHFRS